MRFEKPIGVKDQWEYMCDWFLRKSRIATPISALDNTGVTRRELVQFGNELATLVTHNDRMMRENSEWCFATSPRIKDRLIFIDTNVEDATQLTLAMVNDLGLSASFLAATSATDTSIVHGGKLPKWSAQKLNSKTPSTIVSSGCGYAMLVRRKGDNGLVSKTGSTLNQMQWTDRTTGECYM